MDYRVREFPLFSACGLNCGLCPHHHTAGSSKCPGCAGAGFSKVHPGCGVLSCCQRKGLEYCFFCDEDPCKKYDGADQKDSFITHMDQFRDIEKAKRLGVEAYKAELKIKMEILDELLKNYNDGRRKSFYCLAVNLLELSDLKSVMAQISSDVERQAPLNAKLTQLGSGSDDRRDASKQREKAATVVSLLQAVADTKGIYLKLRNKPKS
jgi:hypothetical protein